MAIARPEEVLRIPAFAAFWSVSTISGFSGSVTVIALQVLVVTTLSATPFEVGIVNAAQFVPYLLVGLLVGALVDRWRRRPILVWSGLGQGLLLAAIPLLWFTGHLQLWVVVVLVLLLGGLSVFSNAAQQSFLPLIVPRERLVPANARLDQSSTVAQTSGPVVGGVLVSLLGAPIAVLVDAVSYVVTAIVLGRIPVAEPRRSDPMRLPHLVHDIREGLRWTYRHPTLAPLAVSTHVWFLANSAVFTAFVPFALRDLGLDPIAYGITLALAGVGGLLGATLATLAGGRLGAGGAILLGRALYPVAWVAIVLSPTVPGSGLLPVLLVVGAGQAVQGFAMGIENANEMGYRQAVAPDGMQGRVNATMRSANRTVFAIGALAGGAAAGLIGYRPTIWIGIAVFAIAALIIVVSPFRTARHPEP